MTLNQLKNFIAVVETASFTKAAEQNLTAQPVISYSVRTLEDEIGVPLLVRSTRSVKLTEAGERFYEDARDIVVRMEAATNRARAFSGTGGSLVIGYSGLTDPGAFLAVIDKFRKRYPKTSINLVRRDMTLSLFEGLYRGDLDIAYCFDMPPLRTGELQIKELGRALRYAILPPDHHLADRDSLFVRDMAGETMLVFRKNPHLEGVSQFPHMHTLNTADIESMVLLISVHAGITILPLSNFAKFENFKLVPMRRADDSDFDDADLVAVWSSRNGNPLVEAFLGLFD